MGVMEQLFGGRVPVVAPPPQFYGNVTTTTQQPTYNQSTGVYIDSKGQGFSTRTNPMAQSNIVLEAQRRAGTSDAMRQVVQGRSMIQTASVPRPAPPTPPPQMHNRVGDEMLMAVTDRGVIAQQ